MILYIMVGAPASTKSTWLQKHAEPQNVVSRDEIRFSMITEEKDYFSKEKDVFHLYTNTIKNRLEKNGFVYADATHIDWKSRKKLINAIGLSDIKIIPIIFNTTLEKCIERNQKRKGLRKVPDSVIEKFFGNYQDPKNDPYDYSDIIYLDVEKESGEGN